MMSLGYNINRSNFCWSLKLFPHPATLQFFTFPSTSTLQICPADYIPPVPIQMLHINQDQMVHHHPEEGALRQSARNLPAREIEGKTQKPKFKRKVPKQNRKELEEKMQER